MASPVSTTTERAEQGLTVLVAAAREALGDTLESIVLYGSAAEGRLRPASDVNVIFVLSRFDAARADALADAVRVAQAAIRLASMFLLRDEIPHASAAFAVKFADIVRRHRVLHGTDPFANLGDPARSAARAADAGADESAHPAAGGGRVKHHRFEDQLVGVITDAAGGLRSAAATLLEREGHRRLAPREALLRVVESLGEPRFTEAVAQMAVAREQGVHPAAGHAARGRAGARRSGRSHVRARHEARLCRS